MNEFIHWLRPVGGHSDRRKALGPMAQLARIRASLEHELAGLGQLGGVAPPFIPSSFATLIRPE